MKEGINEEIDIEKLVGQFYEKAVEDPLIGHFFTVIESENWQAHLKVICHFWDSVIFGRATYKGNPMLKHLMLNKKYPLKKDHFIRWLSLWKETVLENVPDPLAKIIIQKANQIAQLMEFKLNQNT